MGWGEEKGPLVADDDLNMHTNSFLESREENGTGWKVSLNFSLPPLHEYDHWRDSFPCLHRTLVSHDCCHRTWYWDIFWSCLVSRGALRFFFSFSGYPFVVVVVVVSGTEDRGRLKYLFIYCTIEHFIKGSSFLFLSAIHSFVDNIPPFRAPKLPL